MRRLLEEWPRVSRRLREARSIALFLDFDGTLAPLVPDPSQASMNRAARAALRRLTANPRVDVWVISGRPRADLRGRVGLSGISYLGVHGGDAPGAKLSQGIGRAVEDARIKFVSRLNGSAGVLVEDKGIAFAVHYRAASGEQIHRARGLIDRVVSSSGGALRIVAGDRVWEVLPREIRGKGDAVRRQWRLHAASALPIYVGNDATDESAFAGLASGITARVGPARPSRAHYALRNAAEVALFLEKLEEEVRWRPDSNL